MASARRDASVIPAGNGVDGLQHRQQARDVVGGSAMDDVQVQRRGQGTLQDPRGHSHDDELYLRRGQQP
jgi:hypothetical protein